MTENLHPALIRDESSEASLHYYSESEIAKLRELTLLGWKDQAIATEIKKPLHYLRHKRRSLGLIKNIRHPPLNALKHTLGLTPAKAYVIGALLGDGYVAKTKRGGYQIQLVAGVDEDFAEIFASCIFEAYGFKPKILKRLTANHTLIYQIKFQFKAVFDDLSSYALFGARTWRLKPQLLNALSKDENLSSSLLRGFFDADGTVSCRRRTDKKGYAKTVQCCSVNEDGLRQLYNLVQGIIPSSIFKELNGKIKAFHIVMGNKEAFKTFAKRINFNIERKRAKLSYLLQTYKEMRKLKKYPEELYNRAMFLKSQGLSNYRIGKQLGLSYGLIQCWSRREEALND